MANPQRGDVMIVVDGQERIMRLTLGALAGLEERLGSQSLLDLVQAFEAGSFKSSDLLALIWAGLNGGGWDVGFDTVANASIKGGPLEAAKAAARLLALTFADPDA